MLFRIMTLNIRTNNIAYFNLSFEELKISSPEQWLKRWNLECRLYKIGNARKEYTNFMFKDL